MGTAEYVAPEIIRSSGYNKSVDYWAFGILIFELLVGHTPFKVKNDAQHLKTYEYILKGRWVFIFYTLAVYLLFTLPSLIGPPEHLMLKAIKLEMYSQLPARVNWKLIIAWDVKDMRACWSWSTATDEEHTLFTYSFNKSFVHLYFMFYVLL